jgi:hypothetical protein
MLRHGAVQAVCLTLALGLLLAAGAMSVWGFAEEELGFRDRDGTTYPPAGDFPDDRISTVHDDLTFALALAAGFTVTDSHTIRIWDQLVDSEVLPSAPVSYTYGSAGFYTPPDPISACPFGKRQQLWPTARFSATVSASTSRFGPYSPFFHFPHLGGSDLRALRDWAWGTTDTLQGYEAYGWGGIADTTLMKAWESGGCLITRTATISMPVAAGSMEAFATYLHSLADAYSHDDCLEALAARPPALPWGTHTVPLPAGFGDPSVYACDYNPNNPKNDDAHGREFGAVYTDTGRTVAAGRAVYAELSAHSLSRDGLYVPLPLTTPLTVSGTATTLDGAIVHFVTDWDYGGAIHRREYVDSLVEAVLSQPRTMVKRVYLPLAMRQ